MTMLIQFETLKLVRSRRPVIAIASILLFLGLMLLGFYTYAQTETRGHAEFRFTFENDNYFNGMTFALYAFYFSVLMLLPIFAATEGGSQLAGETSSRTLQLLLTRPVSRSSIFLQKLIISAVYMTLLVGLLLGAALLMGLLAVGWGELKIYPGVMQMTDRPQELTQDEAVWAFAMAWPAASLAVTTPLAMSFFLSSCMRNPINAVTASVAVYLVLYVISQVHFFVDLRPYLFTTYMGYWRLIFREEVPLAMMIHDAAKLLAFTFGFLALGYHQFRVREES